MTLAERSYRAYVFGRREGQSSKRDVSLAGVALDGALALSASPVRVLEAGETPDPAKGSVRLCPVSGFAAAADNSAATGVPRAEVGDTVVQLCHVEHIGELERRLVRAETRAGPYVGALSSEVFSAAAAATEAVATPEGAFYPSEWTFGLQRVLVIRVDFPDLTGTPYLSGGAQANPDVVLNAFYGSAAYGPAGAAEFFDRCSYGQTSLVIGEADITPVLRMPRRANLYASGGLADDLINDAIAAARKAGVAVDSYDRQIVLTNNLSTLSNSRFDFSGLGEVGGPTILLNGTLSATIHELGHTYGLRHANRWQSNTYPNNITGAGSSTEYGDASDVMGKGSTYPAPDPRGEFNMWSRNLLGWLPDSAVQTVVASGTYRVYRFDDRSASFNRTLALKIPGDLRGDAEHDYWLGARGYLAGGSAGLQVLWGYHEVHVSDLLPVGGYSGDSLASGRTFSENGVTLTPTISPNYSDPSLQSGYYDVQIVLGSTITLAETEIFADPGPGANAVVTLRRTGTSAGETRMRYETVDGSATAGADFVATSGTVVWADGDTSAKTIAVPMVETATLGAPRSFSVRISGLPYGNGGVSGPDAATVRIAGVGARDTRFAVDRESSPGAGLLVLPDGSVALANAVSPTSNLSDSNYHLMRLDDHGAPASAFSAAGDATQFAGRAQRIVAQPDGKLLVLLPAGTTYTPPPAGTLRLLRLNTDGTLDSTFSAVAALGRFNMVNAVAVQPDGKILVGGIVTADPTNSPPLARLLADGSLDASFQPALSPVDRSLFPYFTYFPSTAVNALALQADGAILAAGIFAQPDAAGVRRIEVLARIRPDGSLDQAFSEAFHTRWIQPNPVNALPSAQGLAVQPDGRILLSGSLLYLGANQFFVRVQPSGQLDESFRVTLTTTQNAVFNPVITAFCLQPDGRIVLSGNFTQVAGVARDHFARLNADGTLDGLFDSPLRFYDPYTSYNPNLIYSPPTALALSPDGGLFATLPLARPAYGESDTHVVRLYSSTLRVGAATFDSAGINAAPGSGSVTLTVRRVNGSDGAVSVSYATVDGTASAARGDYAPQTGVLAWANGDASPRTLTVPLSETATGRYFHVNLGAPIGGVFLGEIAQERVFVGGASGALGVTSAPTASGLVGQPFDYAITVNGAPDPATVFDASGLPPGLVIDHASGHIRGRPRGVGTFSIALAATNALGSGAGTLTLTVTAPLHPQFFNGEVALTNGVYYLAFPANGNVFGYYSYAFFPFLYHFDLGFEYFIDAQDGAGGAFLYDFTSASWFYTSPTFSFPYLYDFRLQAFLYYYPDTNNPGFYTKNPRYFFNFRTNQVITK